MCCHYLSDSPCSDSLLDSEECRSPFGTYELSMPINENAPCNGAGITNKNCKDFDVSNRRLSAGLWGVWLCARCPVTAWDLLCWGISTTAVKNYRSFVCWAIDLWTWMYCSLIFQSFFNHACYIVATPALLLGCLYLVVGLFRFYLGPRHFKWPLISFARSGPSSPRWTFGCTSCTGRMTTPLGQTTRDAVSTLKELLVDPGAAIRGLGRATQGTTHQ